MHAIEGYCLAGIPHGLNKWGLAVLAKHIRFTLANSEELLTVG